MGTLQQQGSKPGSNKRVLSFDEVSKYFSLPLSEAADTLAICRSDLKKICYDNGLVRWPYRKFLSGKSIEEIKMEAAGERNKEPADFLMATGERNDASAVSLASGSQIQSKSSSSLQDMSNSRGFPKQHGGKNIQTGMLQDLQNSNMTNRNPVSLDEFKYGFPSDGLSIASNKWWGGSVVDGKDHFNGLRGAVIQAEEQQPKEGLLDAKTSLLQIDDGKLGSGTDESNFCPLGARLLTTVRERPLEEGRALKVGLYRYGGVKKLGRKERVLLLGIFKSSLPSRCETWY